MTRRLRLALLRWLLKDMRGPIDLPWGVVSPRPCGDGESGRRLRAVYDEARARVRQEASALSKTEASR